MAKNNSISTSSARPSRQACIAEAVRNAFVESHAYTFHFGLATDPTAKPKLKAARKDIRGFMHALSPEDTLAMAAAIDALTLIPLPVEALKEKMMKACHERNKAAKRAN